MAYKLAVKIATKSACYNDPRKMEGQLGVMLHSVGCSQPSADNWATRWNRLDAKVCATYALEPDYVVQVLPETKRPWTSGSGKNGNANNHMIQIEMGEPACLKYGSGGRFTVPADKLEEARAYVRGTYKTAVELFADICKRHKIDPLGMIKGKNHKTILSHAEGAKAGVASNHGDPEHLWSQLGLPYTMDTFRRDVKLAMSAAPTPPKAETVRLTAGTPYYKQPDGKTIAGKIEITTNYTIVEYTGNYGKLKSGAGWVKLADDPAPPTPVTGHLKAWADRNPIKRGTKGKHVEVLQAILYDKGYDIRQVDGDFGAVTENAVKAYQKDQKLTVDGWAGAQVWAALIGG